MYSLPFRLTTLQPSQNFFTELRTFIPRTAAGPTCCAAALAAAMRYVDEASVGRVEGALASTAGRVRARTTGRRSARVDCILSV